MKKIFERIKKLIGIKKKPERYLTSEGKEYIKRLWGILSAYYETGEVSLPADIDLSIWAIKACRYPGCYGRGYIFRGPDGKYQPCPKCVMPQIIKLINKRAGRI